MLKCCKYNHTCLLPLNFTRPYPPKLAHSVAYILEGVSNLKPLVLCRYHLNTSIMLGQLGRSLKWADGQVMRAEMDSQVGAGYGSAPAQAFSRFRVVQAGLTLREDSDNTGVQDVGEITCSQSLISVRQLEKNLKHQN